MNQSSSSIVLPEQAEQHRLKITTNSNNLQDNLFNYLIKQAKLTKFGKDHELLNLQSYEQYKQNVPVRVYEGFSDYFDLIFKSENNILWPGKPDYLFTSSGSTGIPKYIPGTSESITFFMKSFTNIMMQYCFNNNINLNDLLSNKFINFTASTNVLNYNGFSAGPVSGLLRLNQPKEFSQMFLPSDEVLNSMNTEGWDKMFHLVAKQAIEPGINKKVLGCFGLASWVAQFFNACSDMLNVNNLTETFPNFKLFITAGVNYRPYFPQFQALFDHELHVREAYAASEGFFAYQDGYCQDSMLLDTASGVFYEFMPLNEDDSTKRLRLSEVQTDEPYRIIITNTAGLWSYEMGDIIKFTDINPYRIQIVGRSKHFISIQAEHVYSQNVEAAINALNQELKIDINNFTVAPNQITEKALPYHLWYIETEQFHGLNLEHIAQSLDIALRKSNGSYHRSRSRNSLDMPKVVLVKPGGFLNYLAQKNSTSLQLKVPRVSNNRDIADYLINNNLTLTEKVGA